MKAHQFSLLLLTTFLLLTGSFLFAQGLGRTTGTLAGTVVDEKGAPLPGVQVTATGEAGQKTTTTGSNGKFIFPYLTPGTYSVQVHLESYTDIEQPGVEIRLGMRTELNFKMNVGREELVVVNAEAPLIDVSSTTTGANLSDDLLKSIPIGRSFASTISLAPGVTNSGLGGGNLSISGASGLENTYIIDGANITDTGYGAVGSYSNVFGSLGSGFNADVVKEVQVKSGGFEPEYGQALGGVVNVITKSGGNQFAGEGYAYFTPGGLEGNHNLVHLTDLFVTNVVENQSVDGGVNVGGPIVKDKVFFFGAYNPRRVTVTINNDPNAPAFSQFPSTSHERVSQAYSVKLSASMWTKHQFEFSAFGDPSNGKLGFQRSGTLYITDPITTTDPLLQESRIEYGSNTQVGRWTGILRPDMFVEAQFARSHDKFNEILAPQGNVYQYDDLSGPVEVLSGGIGFLDAGSIGTNKQYAVKVTNVWKSHETKYGVQFEDVDYSGGFNYTGPVYTAFNGQQTTTGAIVLILSGADAGLPNLDKVYATIRNRLSPIPVPTATKYLNWFAQDSWNITDRLTAQYGVRWERQVIQGSLQGSETITFSNNWAPRVGATYSYLKNGKAKAYFHYGRFFEKIPNDLAVRSLVQEITSSGYYYDAALSHPIPGTGVLVGTTPTEIEGHAPNTSPFVAKSQYSNEYVAGMEQEIAGGFALGGRFIHRDVQRVLEDIQVDLGSSCQPYLGGTCVPPGMIYENFLDFSGHPSTYFITNQDGHYPGYLPFVRNYNAVEITAEKRLSNNWQLLGSWRIAKLEGNYEGLFRRDNAQSDPNITSLGDFAPSPGLGFTYAHGPLTNDVRHIVKVFSSYHWNNGLTTGLGMNFYTGTPITELGAIPFYGSQERLLSPRGGFGRTDNIFDLDLHADYMLNLGGGSQKLALGMDVFNIFNEQSMVTVVENSQKDNRTYNPRPNPDFLSPNLYEDARTVRFFVKYSF